MDKEKMIAHHYLETGILGAYETTEVAHEEKINGKCAPCFEDATVNFEAEQTTAQRNMMIEGRRFCIFSVFPTDAEYTPTDKLLGLIDTELKKEAHIAWLR